MGSEGLRNMKAVAADIVEGFVTVNPLYLKTFSPEELKALNHFLTRKQSEVRTEAISGNDLSLIRQKNLKLQRLNIALTVLSNYAKGRKIPLNEKETKNKKRGITRIQL
jgi:hypothetical protein